MLELNGKPLASWNDNGASSYFDLYDVTLHDAWDWAKAQDGQDLVVSRDGGEVHRYGGYEITDVGMSGDRVTVRAQRKLEPDTGAAIRALESNVATAQQTAQAAMETAQAAGTEPAVKAASVLYVNATAITNTQLSDVRELIEDFAPGAEYDKGLIRRWEGKYYRMAQKIDSTTSTTYQPGAGMESLYTLIDLAPDGIRVWHAPTDATNSFALGEKAHYPDADGAVYVSQRDGNTSTPGEDEWWAPDSEAE